MSDIPPRLMSGLKGPRGLLAAVIVRATKDAISPGEPEHYADAWGYLNGDSYSHHLDLLGLEPDMLPTMIAEMPIEQIVEQIVQGTSAIYRSAKKHG